LAKTNWTLDESVMPDDMNQIGTEINNKVDKVTGKGLSTNDFTTAEKQKLAGIEEGAGQYVHPLTHPATMITEDEKHRFVTDVEKVSWNAKETTAGSQEKVDALAGAGNTKTVKQLDDEAKTHQADYVKHPAFATATGTANIYDVTLDPAPTAYIDGMGVVVAINADATAATTLNVNGLGAKPIKKANGNAVTNLKANGMYTVRYSSAGTGAFILQGEGGVETYSLTKPLLDSLLQTITESR